MEIFFLLIFCSFVSGGKGQDSDDFAPPIILNCPGDITINTTSINEPVSWTIPTAFDDRDEVSLVSSLNYIPGRVLAVGTYELNYTYSDSSGNLASCLFTLTVSLGDRTPSTRFFCPDTVYKTIDVSAEQNGANVTFDEPTNVATTVKPSRSGDIFPIGITVVEYPGSNCSFNVVVMQVDTTPPVVRDCSDSISLTVGIENNGSTVVWTEPTATDDSGVVLLLQRSHAPGEFFPIGSTHIIYDFADQSGHISSCSFFVTIIQVDNIAPRITGCNDVFGITISLGQAGTAVFYSDPVATDNSGNVSLIENTRDSESFFRVGDTDVRYVFSDPAGLQAVCILVVTISTVDDSAPDVNCPENETVVIPSGSFGINYMYDEPTATDLSGTVLVLSRTHSPGYFFTTGTTTLTYVFADLTGNTAECTFNLTFVEEPEAICPWRAVSATATGIDTTVIWKNPFSLRSGDGDDQADFFSGGQFKVGVSKVMSHNNQSLCQFSVIVEDLNPPTITSCSDDINVQLEFEEEFVAVQWQVPTALDLETRELDIQATHTPGDIFSEGVTTVNYTFTDLSNNQATCNFHINITRGYDPNDSEPPKIINCPNATRIVSIDVPQSGYEIIWQVPSAVDNSGFPVEVTSSHQPGDQLQLGTTTITYEFTDVVGNSASCSFKINIVVSEVFGRFSTCPPNVIVHVMDSTNKSRVFWDEPQFTIAETIITQNHFSGSDFFIGRTDVIYSAERNGVLLDECRFTINILDITPPTVFHCPETLRFLSCRGVRTATWFEPRALDNSNTATSVVQTHYPGVSSFGRGTTAVSYFFTDPSGNTATCHFNVIIHRDRCIYFTSKILIIVANILLFAILSSLIIGLLCRWSKVEWSQRDDRVRQQ